MHTTPEAIVELEYKFWQSMVGGDTDTALALLSEPALTFSEHGAIRQIVCSVVRANRGTHALHCLAERILRKIEVRELEMLTVMPAVKRPRAGLNLRDKGLVIHGGGVAERLT